VDTYEREAAEVVKLFLKRKISYSACMDSALEDYIPRLKPEEAARLRIAMLSNHEIIMNELERRGVDDPA
jgi:hypothetical protein